MCFTASKNSTRKTAGRKITVYKLLRKGEESLYYDFVWEEGKVYISKLGRKNRFNEIDRGFHSFRNIESASKYNRNLIFTNPSGIYEFAIPKGAYYYRNNTEYVSNRLKMVSKKPIAK